MKRAQEIGRNIIKQRAWLHRLGAIGGVLGLCSLAPAAEAREDWAVLSRRAGAVILRTAGHNAGAVPSVARYRSREAGVALVVARAGDALLVRVEAPKGARGIGLAQDAKGKRFVRSARKAEAATPQALWQPLGPLGVAGAALLAPELVDVYEVTLHGQFDDIAVFELKTKGVSAATWRPLKVGISKQFQVPVMFEEADRSGVRVAGLYLEGPEETEGRGVRFRTMRVKPRGGAAELVLALEGFEEGALPKGLSFGKESLR